jgi:hypothetical protein
MAKKNAPKPQLKKDIKAKKIEDKKKEAQKAAEKKTAVTNITKVSLNIGCP